MDRTKFKELLVILRKGRGLNQQDLAEIFSVTTQAVSKWETGDSIPDITTLEKLSSFYGISINDLLNGRLDNNSSINNEKDDTIKVKAVNKSIKYNLFKAIWFSSFALLLFITSFVEYIRVNGVSFNFYNIIFTGDMKIINFFLLISFLVTIAGTVCGIVSSFVQENKKALIKSQLLLTLFGFLVFSIESFLLMGYMSTGLFLLFVLLGINAYASIYTDKLNDGNNGYVDRTFVFVYRLIMLATSVCFMFVYYGFISTHGIPFSIILVSMVGMAVLAIPTLALTIIAYKKNYSRGIQLSRLVLSSLLTALMCLLLIDNVFVFIFIVLFFITNEITFPVLLKKNNDKKIN